MTTLSWLEILLFTVVITWSLAFHIGKAMAEDKKNEERKATMRRHPSNHLRLVQDPPK